MEIIIDVQDDMLSCRFISAHTVLLVATVGRS